MHPTLLKTESDINKRTKLLNMHPTLLKTESNK
jgi:hypothetical protein